MSVRVNLTKGDPTLARNLQYVQILEIYWTNIGDFINKCPINLQYWTYF